MLAPEMRKHLIAWIIKQLWCEEGAFIIPEKQMHHWGVIIDVLVASVTLHGFEIKSDGDGFGKRWRRQKKAYSEVIPFMWLVITADKYVGFNLDHLPDGWGLLLVDECGVTVEKQARDRTAHLLPRCVSDLLWKNELIKFMRRCDLWQPSMKRKSKYNLTKVCGDNVCTAAILQEVSISMRQRKRYKGCEVSTIWRTR